jgi:hypothetical protein
MVEGFRMDEFSEEEIQVEVDQIVEYLQQRLRSNSDDALRFVRVTEADLDMRLDEIEQMRGLVITGAAVAPELKARIQKDIDEEENQRLFPKLVSAVFQVVESGVDDPELLSDMFSQLLDAMLLQEDFAIINQVVLKLRAMEHGRPDSAIGCCATVARMSEEQRLNRVGEVLRFSQLKNPRRRSLPGQRQQTRFDLLDVSRPSGSRIRRCSGSHPRQDRPEPVDRLRTTERLDRRDMVYVLVAQPP